MTTFQNTGTASAGGNVKPHESSVTVGEDANGTATLKDRLCFLRELNILLPYDPTALLFGLPKAVENVRLHTQKKLHMDVDGCFTHK